MASTTSALQLAEQLHSALPPDQQQLLQQCCISMGLATPDSSGARTPQAGTATIVVTVDEDVDNTYGPMKPAGFRPGPYQPPQQPEADGEQTPPDPANGPQALTN